MKIWSALLKLLCVRSGTERELIDRSEVKGICNFSIFPSQCRPCTEAIASIIGLPLLKVKNAFFDGITGAVIDTSLISFKMVAIYCGMYVVGSKDYLC